MRPSHVALTDNGISATVDVSEMMGSEVHLHANANGKDVVIISIENASFFRCCSIYDKIGLFPPFLNDKNGFRCYAPGQADTFHTILALGVLISAKHKHSPGACMGASGLPFCHCVPAYAPRAAGASSQRAAPGYGEGAWRRKAQPSWRPARQSTCCRP